jgi:glycosyltransferase involved in cell wall biosynthesis
MRFGRSSRRRVGWVTSSSLDAERATFRGLPPPVAMRVANVARWIDANDGGFRNELYRRGRRYDVVVFVKAMSERHREEAERAQAVGARIVFDANVNYYEIWGDYDIVDTRPTEEQQRQATVMTRLADWVVADSSYLLGVVRKLTERASWIPDNVDTTVFRPARQQRRSGTLRLVWSGMARKAKPLLLVREAFSALRDAELVVVSNEEPAELEELRRVIPTRFVAFDLRGYARLLRDCDVIVSPKRLVNGYELGHSEWKITLGMATGLPAVASPQQSYVEAIGHRGGGIVAGSAEEWAEALARLAAEPELRAELGRRARDTVVEHYSTPVVARRYRDLFAELAR